MKSTRELIATLVNKMKSTRELIATTKKQYCVIAVTVELMGKYHFVNSPDLPGICLIGKDHEELFNKLPQIIKILFKDNYGMDVEVSTASESDESTWKWAVAA